MAKLKRYLLDNGLYTDAATVSKATGLSLKASRVRLSTSSSATKIFAHKQIHKVDSKESYKLRCIYSRGMFDEMFVLAFKKI